MAKLIKFSSLNNQLADVLIKHKVKETQLRNRYSDLHIICYDNVSQGNLYSEILKTNIVPRDLVKSYRSEANPDHYIVEIGFGAFNHYLNQKIHNRQKPNF